MSGLSRRQVLGLGAGALVAAAGIGYAMTTGSSAGGFEHRFMTVEQMKESGGLIVDIRTPQEWVQTGVIEGAERVTFNNPASFLALVEPRIADGRDLILICRSGNRSLAAAKALQGRIPNRIVSIEGGMRKVVAAGYRPVPAS